MENKLIIAASIDGDSTEQITNTMTVRELINTLSGFDDDTKVYLSIYNGSVYYGGIQDYSFSEE